MLKLRHFTGGWSSKGDTYQSLATTCTSRFHGYFENSGYIFLLFCGVPGTDIMSGTVTLSPCIKPLQWCWGWSVNTHLTFRLKCCQTLKKSGSELQKHLGWFKWESEPCFWVLGLYAIGVGWTVPGPLRLTVPCKRLPRWRSPNCPVWKDQCGTLHLQLPTCTFLQPSAGCVVECRPATSWLGTQLGRGWGTHLGFRIQGSTTDSICCPVQTWLSKTNQ